MLNRSWYNGLAALVALALLAVIADVLIGVERNSLLLDQEWRDQNSYEQGQARHAAESITKECTETDIPPGRRINCILERITHYIGDTHTDQDLQAQNDMAYWAKSLFWLTVIGSGLSGLGIGLLVYSLWQTRRVIHDAREIGEAQTRAYLSMHDASASFSLDSPDNQAVTFRVTIRNTGNSPGTVTFASVDVAWTNQLDNLTFRTSSENSAKHNMKIGSGGDRWFNCTPIGLSVVRNKLASGYLPIIGGVIHYHDVFSRSVIREPFCAVIVFSSNLVSLSKDSLPQSQWFGHAEFTVSGDT